MSVQFQWLSASVYRPTQIFKLINWFYNCLNQFEDLLISTHARSDVQKYAAAALVPSRKKKVRAELVPSRNHMVLQISRVINRKKNVFHSQITFDDSVNLAPVIDFCLNENETIYSFHNSDSNHLESKPF